MLKSTLFIVCATIALCRAADAPKFDPEEIVALERAALDRWGKGDVGGIRQLLAPEVTYFDPFVKVRVDGLDEMNRILASFAGTFTIPRYEIIGPNVQRHGDVAILTFNLVNYRESGQVMNRWNATEVYRRTGGKWKIVHSHWSYTTPETKAETE